MYEMVGVNGTINLNDSGEIIIERKNKMFKINNKYKPILLMIKSLVCEKHTLLITMNKLTKESYDDINVKINDLIALDHMQSEYDFNINKCFERYMDNCIIIGNKKTEKISDRIKLLIINLINNTGLSIANLFPIFLVGDKKVVYDFIIGNKHSTVVEIKKCVNLPEDNIYKSLFELQSLDLISQEKLD